MVEVAMVRRMVLRGILLAPFVMAGLWLFGGTRYAISGAAGLAMTLGNLWLSARIIGGVAERSPQLLLPVAIGTLALGLMLLTLIALGLRAMNAVYFPVTGLTLIISHLGLVLWEASGAYSKIDRSAKPATATEIRS